MSLQQLVKQGENGPPTPLQILRKLRENYFPSQLTVKRFESPLPNLPDVFRFGKEKEGPSFGAALSFRLPLVGVSIGNILDIPYNIIEGTTNSVLEALGVGVTEEQIEGVITRGTKARDITDVTVPISALEDVGIELTEDERRVRNFKRFVVAGGSQVHFIGRGGLARAYQEGLLAEPADEREQIADLAGMVLADIGVTLPFIPFAAPAAAAGVATVGKSAVGVAARRFAPVVPGVPRFLGGKGFLRTFDKMKAAVVDKYGTDVGVKVAERTTQLFTRLGIDAEIGMALGGLHATNAIMAGEDLSPSEFLERVALFTLYGLAFGTAIHGTHAIGQRLSLSRWQNTILSGPREGLEIGFRVKLIDGPEIELVGKGPPKAGGTRGAKWVDVGTRKFIKAPTPEQFAASVRAKVENIQAVKATEIRFEEVPPTMPGIHQRPMEVQSLAGAWRSSVQERAGQVPKEVLRGEMETLTRQAADVGLPVGTRVSLLGRARAIQEVLGELEPEAGVVSLSTESAAIEIVNNVPRSSAMEMAARAEVEGNRALATRIVDHLKQDVPRMRENLVERLLVQGEALTNRGLTKGDRVRDLGNKQYVLLENPEFGVVTAKEIRPAGQNVGQPKNVEVLNLNEMVVRPNAGTTALLKDGQVVEILEAEGGGVRQIVAKRADGSTASYGFDDIAELGHDPRSAKAHQRILRRARRPSREGAETVVPAIVATPEGEVGTLVASGPKGKVVRMRDGQERVVDNVRATKETATTGEREVLAFAPGTRPDPDHHILFAAVPEEQVVAFEAAYAAGQPLDNFLGAGVHVLPPSAAGRGVALYGIELPQTALPNKAYSPRAKTARRAIGGTSVKLETYDSPVAAVAEDIARARIYRVPESLHAKGQRSEAQLTTLRGKERTTYLRRLLDFSEDIDTPVAEALSRRRAAQVKQVEAQAKNDGRGASAAKVESARATADAASAVVVRAVNDAERAAGVVRRRVVATDVNENALLNRALSGDEEALTAIMESRLEVGEDLLLLHKDAPGRVLILQREISDLGEVGRLTATIEEGGRQVPRPLSTDAIADARLSAKELGFIDGLHRRSTPGEFVLDGNPYVRAAVDPGGRVRIYQGERLQGSEQVVWRLDAVGTGVKLEELGFVPAVREAASVPPPYEVGPGGKRTYDPKGNATIEEAAESIARASERQEWAPIQAKLASQGMTNVPGTDAVVGRYLPTGQAVRIVSASIDKPTVSIEFFDGTVRDVAKSEIRPGRMTTNEVRDYRIAQEAYESGTESQLVPKLGLGTLEKELGLFGTDQASIVRDRAVAKAQEHLKQLSIKEGEVLGSPEAIGDLVSLYDRAVDLEFAPDILGLIPKDARQSFVDAAYQHARRQIPEETYSLLFSGAKYDKLTPEQVKAIRKIGADHNISRDLPLYRVAEDLWNKRLIDPFSAQWTLSYRQDLGVVRMASEANLDPSAVTFVMRPPRGISWPGSRGFNPSHFELSKNPTMQAFESTVRAADEVEAQFNTDLMEWGRTWQKKRTLHFADGTKRRLNNDDFALVRDLIEEHGSWAEAVKAGAIKTNDPRRLFFEQLVERFEVDRQRHVRLNMMLGTKPVNLFEQTQAVRDEFFSSHPWVDPVLAEKGGYWIVPSQLQRFKAEGLTVRRSLRTDEEITEFLALTKRHDTSVELPQEVTGWMREEFDLWKRFGIDNYWPRVHEGEFSLEVQTAAGWKGAGYTESYLDATLLYRQLRKEGQFGKVPFRVVHRKAYADDIVQETMSRAELFTWVESLRDATIANEETLAGLFLPSAGRKKPSPVLKKPVKGSLAERTSDLRPPKRHPWQELVAYERKLARLEKRFKIAQAYRTFMDKENPKARALDKAVNAAEGGTPLFNASNAKLYRYAERWARDAIGLPGTAETVTNQMYNYYQMLNYGPRVFLGGKWESFLRGEQSLTLKEVFDSSKWETFGSARKRASELISFQAQWRMMMGPSTAMINLTQYHLYTVPMLQREFGIKAAWASRGAWLTGVRLWTAQQRGKPLTGTLKKMNEVADAAGVNLQPGRQMGGATSLAGTIESSLTTPVTFGLNNLGKARAWGNLMGMYMFNSAERINRLSTAVASYNAARFPKARGGLGLGHDAAIAKTKEIIGRTQFWYDELNLPQLMRQGGPAARVLLQFKPFMINAMRYEIDMANQAARGLARGDLGPAAAAAHHAALYAVYGGAMGALRHPLISATLWTAGMLPFVPGPREIRARTAERLGSKPEDLPRDESELPDWARVMLLHGVPGLLGMSLGSRLGEGGQELASLGTSNALGPHVSTMNDFRAAITAFAAQSGNKGAAAIVAAGFFAPQFIPGPLGRVVTGTPYSRLVGAYATAFGPGGEKWREFLSESPEGRRFVQKLLLSFVRNGTRANEIFQHGFYVDTKGRRIEVPYGDEAAEAVLKLGGFPTTGEEERRAYLEWIQPKAYQRQSTSSQLVRAAAAAWSRGDRERAHQIVLGALEQGIFIRWEQVEEQIERGMEDQVEGVVKQLPPPLRRLKPGQ